MEVCFYDIICASDSLSLSLVLYRIKEVLVLVFIMTYFRIFSTSILYGTSI